MKNLRQIEKRKEITKANKTFTAKAVLIMIGFVCFQILMVYLLK